MRRRPTYTCQAPRIGIRSALYLAVVEDFAANLNLQRQLPTRGGSVARRPARAVACWQRPERERAAPITLTQEPPGFA